MKHATYVQLTYDHKGTWPTEEAIVEVQAEDGQLLNELAKMAKEKLCSALHLPTNEVNILDYSVGHALPIIILDGCRVVDASAVDAAPVVHGRWVFHKKWDLLVCSECNYESSKSSKYCPDCGAKMDLK